MRAKWPSEKFIDALSADHQVDHLDPLVPDFGLRINPGGTKTWWVRVTVGGRRLRLKIGRWPVYTRDEAWEVAREWIKLADRGINPKVRAAPGITLGKLFERYIKRQREKGLRYWEAEQRWFRAFDALAQRPAAGIERREIRELLAAKRTRGAPTAENARALLSRVYRFGIEEDLVTADPTDGIRRLSASNARSRVLSDEEIRTLWARWESEATAEARAQQLMLLLGTRHTETLRIRRDLIRDGWIEIEAKHTKSGRPHLAPVTASVAAVLEAAQALAGPSPWLFPSVRSEARPLHSVSDAVIACREATGIVYTAHDLRRTTYSALRRLGIKEEVIAAFFNHAKGGLRRNYDHWSYAPERLEAAEVWHADLERILEKREPGRVVPIHRQA